MDSTYSLREITTAINEIKHTAGSTYVLHQLEILNQYSSRSSQVRQLQNGDQVDLIECLTFLVKVVSEREYPELLRESVQILLNLSHNEDLRLLLHETFSLSSPLAALILAHSSVSDNQVLLESLQLMQKITYGHRIDFYQAHIDELVHFLVTQTLKHKDLEELLPPVLGTVANLCRNNILVQSAIKNNFQSQMNKLLKILTSLFDHTNKALVISSLSVFVSISINEPKGQKVFFDSDNVQNVLQAIFNVLVHHFKMVTWKCAADLLADLLRMSEMKICITRYHHLESCLSDILGLLAVGSEDSVSDVFELLLRLCVVPHVRQLTNSLLFSPLVKGQDAIKALFSKKPTSRLSPDTPALVSCVYWASQTGPHTLKVARLALEFMADSVQFKPEKQPVRQDNLRSPATSPPTHLLTPVFVGLLSQVSETEAPAKTVHVLKLLTVLCSDKLSREALGKTLTLEIIKKLVESLLSQGYASYAASTSQLSITDRDKKEEGTQCVLLALSLAAKVQKLVSGMPQYLVKTLQEPRVQDFMGLGVASGSQDQVEVALTLFAMSHAGEDARPQVPLCSLIASLNRHRRDQRKQEEQNPEPCHKVMRLHDNVLQSKENNRPGPNHSNIRSQKSENDKTMKLEEHSIDELISRMQTVLEPTSTKTAEVIEVFEHHIKSLQVKEEHLNNLLEAKTMALTQADRVIGQMRSRQASHAAEMKKLQEILKQGEHKGEQMVGQMNKMRLEAEKQQQAFDKRLNDKSAVEERLAKEMSDMTDKCSDIEDKLNQCQQEKKTLGNMKDDLQHAHEILKEQYNTACQQSQQLEEERKTLSKTLKEKDAACQKLSASLATLQTSFKTTEKERSELEKEKETLENYIDKLRIQVDTHEAQNRQLQQKTKTLEGINEVMSKELQQKTSRIGELDNELEKHDQIVSFINQMNLKKDGKK